MTIHRKEIQAITIGKGTTLNHRNNTRYQNSPHNYRSSTPKHQRQIYQKQSTEETQPDPLVMKTMKAQNYN